MQLKTVSRQAFFVQIFLLIFSTLAAQDKNSPAVDSVIKPQESIKHIYRMNYWVTGTFNVLATAGNFYAIPNILHAKKPVSHVELNALDRSIVNGIDRLAFKQDVTKWDKYYKASDIILPSVMLGGFSILADKKIRKDWPRIVLMYYELHAATFSVYNFSFFGPAFQNKLRPIAYYHDAPIDRRTSGGARNSMFSGHTANVTAATFFVAKVYSDYHPEIGRKKYLVFALASIPPLVQGYLRIKALAHFPSDIMVGYAIGTVMGIAVPALHRYRNREINVGLTPVPNGAGVRVSWTPSKKERPVLNSFTEPYTVR